MCEYLKNKRCLLTASLETSLERDMGVVALATVLRFGSCILEDPTRYKECERYRTKEIYPRYRLFKK
jgi:hypothetical protein